MGERLSESAVRERLLAYWAPGVVDVMLLDPDPQIDRIRFAAVGVVYRDGGFYLLASPEGGHGG